MDKISKIKNWLLRITGSTPTFQVEVLDDPVFDSGGWSYPVRMISKTYRILWLPIKTIYYEKT